MCGILLETYRCGYWFHRSVDSWIAVDGTFSASLPKSFQNQDETSEIGSVSKPGGRPVV